MEPGAGGDPPGRNWAALLHREAEAMRRAYIERNANLGDPAFVTNPVTRLISKAHGARLRKTIDSARATPTPAAIAQLREGPSTTHFSVVDAAGNSVSLTTTINSLYGNAVTVRGAGFLLNDEMDDFTTVPGRANQWGSVDGGANLIAPGKRMLSSMTPTIVLDPRGRLYLLVGSPGGTTIITTVYHIVSNLIDHGMTLAAATAADVPPGPARQHSAGAEGFAARWGARCHGGGADPARPFRPLPVLHGGCRGDHPHSDRLAGSQRSSPRRWRCRVLASSGRNLSTTDFTDEEPIVPRSSATLPPGDREVGLNCPPSAVHR